MKHVQLSDYLAHVLEGAPLSCGCSDCRERAALWERERGFPAETAGSLPPGFWARQEQTLEDRLAGRARPVLRWAFAAGATALVVAGGLIATLRPSREARWTDIESRYETALAGLDQPTLGDLEACSLVLTETTDTSDIVASEEESQ